MFFSRRNFYILFLVLGIFILSLIVFKENRPEHLRVGLRWLDQAQFAGFYVADYKEYYSKKGLKVSIIERSDQEISMIDKINNGDLDFAVISMGDFLKASDRGYRIKALAAVFQNSPVVIASLKSKNILHPADLRGRRLGISNNREETKLPFYALLKESGIPINGVIFKNVGFQRIDALVKNEVDAIAIFRTNELYDLDKLGLDYRLIFPEKFGISLYDDILVTSGDHNKNDPKIVKKFLEATMRGWNYADKNPEEALDITLLFDNPKYHDRTKEKFILENTLKLVRTYPNQTIGQMIPLELDYSYSLFRRHGIIGEFDIKNFLADPEILKYIHESNWR